MVSAFCCICTLQEDPAFKRSTITAWILMGTAINTTHKNLCALVIGLYGFEVRDVVQQTSMLSRLYQRYLLALCIFRDGVLLDACILRWYIGSDSSGACGSHHPVLLVCLGAIGHTSISVCTPIITCIYIHGKCGVPMSPALPCSPVGVKVGQDTALTCVSLSFCHPACFPISI